jgi:hypothetical protein
LKQQLSKYNFIVYSIFQVFPAEHPASGAHRWRRVDLQAVVYTRHGRELMG